MKITASDIRGVVGIVPTPATPDAERWDATQTVNLPESEKMIHAIVDAGIDIIMTTGTFGECSTLTWPELQSFIDCVVQTSAGRRPVFAGITTLNTRDTIERGRALMALGADGLFIGRPMWVALDDRQIVRYYRDIAEALPGTPIVAYDNPGAFKGKIANAVYAELAKIPEIVAAKHVGGPALETDMRTVGENIRILPLETDWYPIAQTLPDLALACWSGAVACAPSPIAALGRAIIARDWATAETLHEKTNWACETMFPDGDFATFLNYSIQLGHARFRAAGLIDPGPTRPPYAGAPDDYVAGAEEVGRRWATLEREYARQAAGVTP
jgi:dihydrodipicolinate synthase/N-acetylneuraminate lyase